MSAPRFKISDRIKVKEYKYRLGEPKDNIEGHIVLIMNPYSEDREYYCSMYPGAQENYCYVECFWISVF